MMENECKIYNNSEYGDCVSDVVLMPVFNRKTRECYRCVIPAVCLDRRVYRLKSARGNYRIVKVSSKLWELKRRFTTIGRLTLNPLRVYAALYQINRNGGNNNETA